jgi:hypothetical protein
MLGAKAALAAGLLCMAVGILVVLSHSPVQVLGSNGLAANPAVANAGGDTGVCEPGGTVPAGTTALRLSLSANIGPRVEVTVSSGSTVVAHGVREAGWGVDESVTVPVGRVRRAISGARVCASLGPAIEPVQVNGSAERVREAGGRVGETAWPRLEYLRAGGSSWLSRAGAVARRMGLGRAPSGSWVAYLALTGMIAVLALISRLILREVG